jgi:putative glutamine amidotransferase
MAVSRLAEDPLVKSRPVIGVTGPDRGGLAAWWFTALAVRRAGGRPRRIRPKAAVRIERLEGLIIGGGADVSPRLYGQHHSERPTRMTDRSASGWRRLLGIVLFPLVFLLRRLLTTKHSGPDPARDALEQALIEQALDRRLPVFGICRGMQLINVAAGGSLKQDLEGYYEEYPAIRSVLPRKRIQVRENTRIGALIGTGETWVNALHSQAIDDLAGDLQVAAVEDNGIIQAIEHAGDDWLLGVQWHPEYLPQRRRQQALFAALVDAARRGAHP